MTIDEAIKILQPRDGKLPHITQEQWEQAVKLGIEALEHIKMWMDRGIIPKDFRLPGETND